MSANRGYNIYFQITFYKNMTKWDRVTAEKETEK